ncbi:MAG: hypothetical protein ACTSSE_12280 [Candidatus Thorarchaeota archaeon]
MQAEQDGRFVDLKGMIDLLQFSKGMKRSVEVVEDESHTAV